MKGFESYLKQIFSIFDYNGNGTFSQNEMCNCLTLMCGGTIKDKIQAAFILQDKNNSNTLTFEELSEFMASIFKVFDAMRQQGSESMISKIDFYKLTHETATICFENLSQPITGEITFEQFLTWINIEFKKPNEQLETSLSMNQTSQSKKSPAKARMNTLKNK